MEVYKNNGVTYVSICGVSKKVSQWANECKLNVSTLYGRIEKGCSDEDFLKPTRPKHEFNNHYFDVIDGEHKAYWLGFIYADGYLNSKNYTIGIELKQSDIEHVEKFKNDICSNRDVKIYNKNSTFGPQTNCRFVFNDSTMYEALLCHGLTHLKSYNGTFPKLEDEEYVWPLIRGIFDGDGSISYRVGANGYLTANIGVCGTQETLRSIEQYSGFKWNWYQCFPDRDVNNWQVSIGRQDDIIQFLSNMYENSTIHLDRKYQKYIDITNSRKDLVDNRVPRHSPRVSCEVSKNAV